MQSLPKQSTLSVYYQNVRWLKSKLEQWRNNLIIADNLQLVAATETNTDESVSDAELCGAGGGWTVLRRDRRARAGGGVLLAAAAPIVLERLPTYETSDGEDLWAKFLFNGHSLYVCVVYIPPTSSDDTYMKWFNSVETMCSIHGSPKLLVFGDLNLHSASNNVNNYFKCFSALCDLVQYNCVSNKNKRMLDVVLASAELGSAVCVRAAEPAEQLVKVDGHHPPLMVDIRYSFSKQVRRLDPSNISAEMDWNFRKGDFFALYNIIKNTNWNHIYNFNDVNNALNFFYNSIYDAFDLCIPKKVRKTTSSRVYPVYYTKSIIRDIQCKAESHRMWKRTGDPNHRADFQRMRSQIKGNVKTAHLNYTKMISDNLCKNPKEFWQYINSLRTTGGLEPVVTRGEVEYTGRGAAGAFADHFSSVFLPERPALDPAAAAAAPPADCRRVHLQALRPADVRAAVGKLKPGSSPGPDAVPAYIIKGCLDELIAPITYIFNLILDTGHYPTRWKKSRVTPIPKSGSKTKVENYRPIAILSALAKVFETALHNSLLPQCLPYITDAQHAFLPRRSVNTNLVTLVDYVSREMDHGNQVDVVYLDFQKAFDRVDNDTLLVKLGTMGFTPRLLKLFASYLSDRQQYVKYGAHVSDYYLTPSGVSQGSNLGPFLFLILINDLPDVVRESTVLIYADDVKLVKACRTPADHDALQRDIGAVHAWSVANRLHFNLNKCEAMTFSRGRSPRQHQYSVGDAPVARVQGVRDLGVWFDPELTLREHAQRVTDAAHRRLGFVLRNAAPLSTAATRTLYAALVRSVVESSAVVWSPHEDKYIIMLERIQKKFLRSLYKKTFAYYPYLYPTLFIQGQLGYQSLEVRRSLALSKFTLQVLRNKIDCVALVQIFVRLAVPSAHCAFRLRARAPRVLAPAAGRTAQRRQSPAERARHMLGAVLAEAPHCDLFASEMACLMNECRMMYERNGRKSTIE